MTACKIAKLSSRSAIRVGGEDAAEFLQNIITNDVKLAHDNGAVHAALLTPQGKILFDFLLIEGSSGFLLDVPVEVADDLIKRLTFYRLRARVDFQDQAQTHNIFAVWGETPQKQSEAVTFVDPRLESLGHRMIVPSNSAPAQTGCEQAREADYHAHRIALGVPEGGLDFTYGNAFPHEVDFDQLGGIDFSKGCYVGQEVVSRMEHRGTARKRIVPVTASSPLTTGDEIKAGDSTIGTVGSTSGNNALALVRLDRAQKALDEGKTFDSAGTAVRLRQPSWASFNVPEGPDTEKETT